MQIQLSPQVFSQGQSAQANSQVQGPPSGERPPGPPPGGIPPGLDAAVSELSTEQQQSTQEMLQSLSVDQQEELKQALDILKPSAENMSTEEIGNAFFEMLTSISGGGNSSESENIVDVYV